MRHQKGFVEWFCGAYDISAVPVGHRLLPQEGLDVGIPPRLEPPTDTIHRRRLHLSTHFQFKNTLHNQHLKPFRDLTARLEMSDWVWGIEESGCGGHTSCSSASVPTMITASSSLYTSPSCTAINSQLSIRFHPESISEATFENAETGSENAPWMNRRMPSGLVLRTTKSPSGSLEARSKYSSVSGLVWHGWYSRRTHGLEGTI